ncbi:MAG: hypothetical protein JSV91_16135 [Phycisphaerales bacterium]|nr:MAG: hypothetical protein JSV91_16135 [Phycisphaerales bacterium]
MKWASGPGNLSHRDAGERLSAILSRTLGQSARAPDMTRSIMGRLGFMHASPRVARRYRIRRRINRALFTLAMVTVILAAVQVHQHSPQARRPVDQTLPAAIGSGLNHHQNGLSNVIRTIRNLAPPVQERPAAADQPDAVPASLPVELDEDVDRSAIAPVRWV